MSGRVARLHFKTRLLAVVVILANVLGNFFLSLGMKAADAGRFLLTALLDPWVLLGIALLVVWLLSRMTLLSWADLSYVLPVTSLGYVLTALAGRFLLGEAVSTWRWAGVALIVAGVGLVQRTPIRTTRPRGRREAA